MQELDAIEPDVDAAELEIACSISDTDSTADDLAGPGRALDKLYTAAGTRLEDLLGKVAVVIGKGPLVTAHRIRRNRLAMICMTSHGSWCQCDNRTPKSPSSLIKAHREISQDCNRLVRYVRSREPSTQKQAIDSILDLSIWDGELLEILKANDARRAISSSIETIRRFYPGNSAVNDSLLNSSRKTLLYLDETRLSSLLKTSASLLELSFGIGWKRDDSDLTWDHFHDVDSQLNSLWEQTLVYLSRPELAFVVLRYLRPCITKILDLRHRKMLDSVFDAMKKAPAYFEWRECEEMLCGAFSHFEVDNPSFLYLIADWILRNAPMMPRLFEIPALRPLTERVYKLNAEDLRRRYRLLGPISNTIDCYFGPEPSLKMLESRYTYHKLRPLLEGIACSTMMKSMAFLYDPRNQRGGGRPGHDFDYVMDLLSPDEEECWFFERIVEYIRSSDPVMRASHWTYLNYFLTYDIYRCQIGLGALSQIGFNPRGGLDKFIEDKLGSCIPYLCAGWIRTFHRHLDAYGRKYFNTEFNVPCACEEAVFTTRIEVPSEWLLHVRVRRGEAFSAESYYPLITEHDEHGCQSFFACVGIAPVTCRSLLLDHIVCCTISDGTKPEDLRVEVKCPHRIILAIPKEFRVPVLRYAPDAYASVLGVSADSLYTTGPFAWINSEIPNEHEHDPFECQRRVLTVEEARAIGYAEELIFPEIQKKGSRATYRYSCFCNGNRAGELDDFTPHTAPNDPHTPAPGESSDDMCHGDEARSRNHQGEAMSSNGDEIQIYRPECEAATMRSDAASSEFRGSQDGQSVSRTLASLHAEHFIEQTHDMQEDGHQNDKESNSDEIELDDKWLKQSMPNQRHLFFFALILVMFAILHRFLPGGDHT